MNNDILLQDWAGPLGGLPPFDAATPEALEAAMTEAIALKRAEVQAIAASAEPPSFANTVEALERSGRPLRRVTALFRLMAAANSVGEMPAVTARVTPLLTGLDTGILFDQRLFARIDAVHAQREGLPPEARRLTEVTHRRFVRAGVGLAPAEQQRLADLNARIDTLAAQYNQHLIADGGSQFVWIEDEAELDGVPAPLVAAARALAAQKGRPGAWAIQNARSAVWPVLTHARHRGLRERVWRMWNERGDHAGPTDNKPVAAEILQLRGEKARLLGHESFAHMAIGERMARRPETVMALLQSTWRTVHAVALQQIAQYTTIAREEDGLQDPLQPWDRQFYAERLRRRDLGFDGEALRQHLTLDNVLGAMFDSAARTFGLRFIERPEAPRLHPAVRVYEVRREDGAPQGVLYFDLFNRPGKMHGSYQAEYRTAELDADGTRVLPISAVHSSFEPQPGPGGEILLPFEYANVFFHEFGHALHMLLSRAPYPSLGSVGVPWDFVEVPALLNERWLLDRGTLARFALHAQTGAPVPDELVDQLQRSLKYDRVFSLNLDYLAPAILDLRMHLLADGAPGRSFDVAALEAQVLRELDMPPAWDTIMRITSNFHSFPGGYAAGVYGYLWADVMAADAAEAFLQSPGGFNDRETGRRWDAALLGAAWTVEPDEAWRRFRGRAVDPAALLRRFRPPA
ncbi:M3 family metallopeptidase, partial [Pelomonas sp. KK5]|uniref:M3 family metallopeptidase n=1 Tax=Pelomonas sp. KK5 TaxID=1855730 RepID=UPI00097BC8F1